MAPTADPNSSGESVKLAIPTQRANPSCCAEPRIRIETNAVPSNQQEAIMAKIKMTVLYIACFVGSVVIGALVRHLYVADSKEVASLYFQNKHLDGSNADKFYPRDGVPFAVTYEADESGRFVLQVGPESEKTLKLDKLVVGGRLELQTDASGKEYLVVH
jgi:hypothetical protein